MKTINSFFENNKILINHILLIFRLYVYKSRGKKFININNLIARIRKVKRVEKEIALNDSMKTTAFRKKFNNLNGLCSRVFDEEIVRLHLKNHSEKWSGSLLYVFVIVVVVVVVCFVFVVALFF